MEEVDVHSSIVFRSYKILSASPLKAALFGGKNGKSSLMYQIMVSPRKLVVVQKFFFGIFSYEPKCSVCRFGRARNHCDPAATAPCAA